MTTNTTIIGLVELPELVPPVSAAGFVPLSAPDLRSVATEIRSTLTAGTDIAVVAMQTHATGLRPFLTRVAKSLPAGRRVALLVPPGNDPIDVPGAVVVTLPAPLPDVFAAAGVDVTDEEAARLAAVIITEDGTPRPAPHSRRAPVDETDDWLAEEPATATSDGADADDPWADDPPPSAARPAVSQAPQEPPAPTSDADDPWADDPAPTPTPQAAYRPDPNAAPAAVREEPREVAPPPVISADPQPPAPDTHRQPRPEAAPYRPPEAPQTPQEPVTAPTPPTEPHGPSAAASSPLSPTSWPDRGASPASAPVDPLDMFGAPDATADTAPPAFTQQRMQDLAPVVFSFARKGGVGKTSMSLNVTQRACDVSPGLRTVLVDMNRGQGDTRKYLRVPRSTELRSMFDAAVSGTPAAAILAPDELNAARHSRLPPARFAVALAPVGDQCDPSLVTPEVYASVIDVARRNSDLVVVDTQIVGASDTELFDRVVVPLLQAGAWGLALTDTSNTGIDNLAEVLTALAADGVPPDRIFMVINKIADQFADQSVQAVFGDLVSEFRRIDYDETIHQQMNLGRFVHAHRQMAPVIDELLHRVLGRPEFDHSDEKPAGRKGGFRLFRRGR